MVILSKANLVDEGIDLKQIKNFIRNHENRYLPVKDLQIGYVCDGGVSVVVGEDSGNRFLKLLGNLQEKHYRIQKV